MEERGDDRAQRRPELAKERLALSFECRRLLSKCEPMPPLRQFLMPDCGELSLSLQRHLTLLLRLPCLLLLFDLYPLLMRFFVVERQLLGEFVFAKLRELHLPLFLRSPLLGFKLLCLLLLVAARAAPAPAATE